MKYHRHPKQGTGQNDKIEGVTVPIVYFNVTYDWDNMLDRYNSRATAQQENAVATLMYHVASARNMGYDFQYHIGSVLYENFGYEFAKIRYRSGYLVEGVNGRVPYTEAEWTDIIKDQLDDGLPVYYAGRPATRGSPGHAFVLDGYDSKNNFHVNWGWGGSYDGW